MPTTDYTSTSNIGLFKPTPGMATDWGTMFNDNADILDTEVKALQDLAHVAATLTANAQDYLSLDVATQTITLNQIDLTTDVSGLLPYTQLSGAPTNLSQFTNDPGFITASNNLSDLSNVATAKTNLGLATVASSGAYADLSGTPNLHAVALSGSYTDLVNLPDLTLKADLVSGKIPASQIPSIAITEFLGVAADASAMVGLTGQAGDWCNRTDTGTTYVITAGTGSNASDWMELNYPADIISSVNGQTGAVVLTHADVNALPNSTYIPQSGVDFDPVGTQNSVDVSLVTTAHDYLSITGQAVTLGPIDLATDVTGQLPIANTVGLHAVASSGSYTDLINTPTNVTAFTNDALYLTTGNNLSELTATASSARANLGLHAVAASGSWADLVAKPANVSYWTNDSGYITSANNLSDIASAPSARANLGLATVAASGSYADLSNVPTNLSQFTNDNGFLEAGNNLSELTGTAAAARTNLGLKPVAASGSYTDLTNKPFIPLVLTDLGIADGSNGQVLQTNGAGVFSFVPIATTLRDLGDTTFTTTIDPNSFVVHDGVNWKNKNPAAAKTALGLATVASSGDYADLSNVPTAVSAFSNDQGYLTGANNLSDLGNVVTARTNLGLHALAVTGAWADVVGKPTAVSAFANDTGYLTAANNLSEVVNKATARTNLGLHNVAASGSYSDLQNLPDLTLKADLVSGKIPVSQIPSIAITEYKGVAADQTAMIAMVGEPGDWCNRTDTQTTYIITQNNGSQASDWVELQYPADTVNSVNGHTGSVVLTPADIGAMDGTQYIPQSGVDFDNVGTDNSVNVTLSGGYDYLTLTGQQIALNQIDLTTDVTGQLPYTQLSGVPTNVSTFANDSLYLAAGNNLSELVSTASTARNNLGLHAIAASGDYNALNNKPYIPQSGVDFDAPGSDNSVDTTLNTAAHDYLSISGQEITLGAIDLTADVTNNLPVAQVSGLHTISTSGDYGDLQNVPGLENRHDVQISNLQTGQFLVYDSTVGKWVNGGIGYGGNVVLYGSSASAVQFDYTLASHTDVLLGTPSDGQILQYDSNVGQWVNATVTGIDPGFTKTTLPNGDVEFDFAP